MKLNIYNAHDFETAVSRFPEVKAKLSSYGLEAIKTELGLTNLRTKRAKAMVAAHYINNPEIYGSTDDSRKLGTTEVKTFLTFATLKALAPVPPTNGMENTPLFKMFKSPLYRHELTGHYLALATTYHPDNKQTGSADIFAYISKVYKTLIKDWDLAYSPFNKAITSAAVEKMMGINPRYSPAIWDGVELPTKFKT